MQTTSLPDLIAGGVDQRYYPSNNTGAVVRNFRYSPDGGWRNDRGWEPLVKYPVNNVGLPTFGLSATELADVKAPCRFLSVWQRHGGSEEYYVQERNGNLFYEFGNLGTATTRKHTLATGRHLPRTDEPGTQLVPYGRFALLMNGHDPLLKWWGRDVVYPFGFILTPPTPYIVGVQVDYNQKNGEANGDPVNNDLNAMAVQFAAGEYLGLGDPTAGSINFYSYKVTYITDTGSESPLSGAGNVSWTLLTDLTSTDPDVVKANARKYGVMVQGLEPGPDGTVARRIYRTKNKKDGLSGAGDIYYLVTQINDNTTRQYLDCIPDNELVTAAPAMSDSVPISSTYKYGAAWNGSMWLAGGDTNPTQIIYSAQGLPEQFPAFNTFDVGVRDGGHITALFPYYDVLLVFRERSIDAVFTNGNGDGYTCTTINQTIGTTASGTIKLIPGVGVMFLNLDGFFMITGGMRGGATIAVEQVSMRFEKEMGRLSKNALPRATATYSDREKEYWCHFPVDGQTENTHGVVFNTVTNEWSFRSSDIEGTAYDWRFTQLATDGSGYIIIGTLPSPTSNNLYPGMGLQVWSARDAAGDDMPYVTLQGLSTVNYSARPAPNATWQSVWLDFGDDSIKKRVLTVELETLTEGDNEVELQWASDYSSEWNSAGTVAPQIGDYLDAVGPANDATFTTGGNVATWNTSKWQDHKVTRLRWDVNTGLVSHFAFRVVSTNRFTVIKYMLNFIGGQLKTQNTKMPGAQK